MKTEARHIEGMKFEVKARQHAIILDSKPPFGNDEGPSPKEILLGSILVCSGMDVVGLLKKHRHPPVSFHLSADAPLTENHPKIFQRIDVSFIFSGQDPMPEKIKEAVELSMTKYCGVSAMITPTSPIFYKIEINGEVTASGQARF